MKKKKKIIIILGVIVVVAIIIVANVLKSGEKTYKVQAEKVNRSDITSIVTANGKIVPRTDASGKGGGCGEKATAFGSTR
ncbi:hypothetical protein AMJ44_13215 [candidate division WOR-1 bacterium DG_54_3]|uniref:Uncharacterized protein n=1 Tax=candidate division WOR-1 bacterium DG_54_3 TaxID=1703775 RepID=A0A0S7XPP0_UNCSA|nr:MAG: hypothetical protein AMJ44_13215 [candidate division WOR-1 bacterium DG_54_3]